MAQTGCTRPVSSRQTRTGCTRPVSSRQTRQSAPSRNARSIACPSSRVKNGRSHATHKAASERIALSTLSSAPNGPQPGRRSGTSRQSAPGSSDACCAERSFSEKGQSSPARYRTSVLPRHGRSALSVPIRREAPPANSAAQIVCSCMPRSFASVTRPLFVSRDSRK